MGALESWVLRFLGEDSCFCWGFFLELDIMMSNAEGREAIIVLGLIPIPFDEKMDLRKKGFGGKKEELRE